MRVYLTQSQERSKKESVLPFSSDLSEDLQLESILEIMAKKDKYVRSACRRYLCDPLSELSEIRYRNAVLQDAIRNKTVVFDLYVAVAEVVSEMTIYRERMKKQGNPSAAIRVLDAIEQLDILASGLEKLKKELNRTSGTFAAKGFVRLYEDFAAEFHPEFMQLVHEKKYALKALQTGGELRVSGRIGAGCKGTDFLVNHVEEYQTKKRFDKIDALFHTKFKKDEIRIRYDKLDLLGDCRELESAALMQIAGSFQGMAKDIGYLFESLRSQLAFVLGCCNLHNFMSGMAFPLCFPEFSETAKSASAEGLYDLTLGIESLKIPVANEAAGGSNRLYVITGTNHGGKTTYLKSIGVAQVMAQAGMFVPAKQFTTTVFPCIFTHFTRSEDVTMSSGRLDEELGRLSKIIDRIQPGSMVLLNESFATTAEREGANIAEDIIRCFYDCNMTVYFVTHIYSFAKKAYDERWKDSVFLHAERLEDGTRTYRLFESEPKSTGYGLELYEALLGTGQGLA